MQDATFADTWVVLPTYDEIDNLEGIAGAILERLPGATLLVVDDSSPDGTGELADRLAAANPRIRVRHRPGKEGLGKAYIDGFAVALEGGARRVVQMDADWSHSPDYLPPLVSALAGGLDAPRPDGADLAGTWPAAASSTGASDVGSCRGAVRCSRGSCCGCRPTT